jgi:hypothetical protein
MTAVKKFVAAVKKAIEPVVLHAEGQALAWYTIAEHDLSKWEAAAAAGGTLALTSVIRKINGWLGTSSTATAPPTTHSLG